MFNRVLVANRGEIALRIIQACREMDIETVAVYSEADKDAIYLELADQAICIGPAAPADSYLDISRIMAAAEVADVDAIHPGYGFLAENAHFAEVCRDHNIAFIGPSPENMRTLGDKNESRKIANKAGVPINPGSEGIVGSNEEALSIAREIGYPVMIKATAGGGGRGMRVAHNDMSLSKGLLAAQSEAQIAFGNGDCFIEKYIEHPHHVEVQVMADQYGNVVSLGERDCSLQRRHQKLVEESPCPFITDKVRTRMWEAAVSLCKAANYSNAGTVEFIVDQDMNFYFLEVNTRIQVEHTVTEQVTGMDLIAEQIRLAFGEELGYTQEDIKIEGWAIEVRVNAEDPGDNFKPCPGEVKKFFPPRGKNVRWDSHVYSGFKIKPNYDSMIGKLIVRGDDRLSAIFTMRRCLDDFVLEGIKTTIPLYKNIFRHRQFMNGNFDTGFLEKHFK